MIKSMKAVAFGSVVCAAVLVAGIGMFALGQVASGAEGAAAANPYVGVTNTTYGDEDMAAGLIQAGTTFSDLDHAGVAVLLDEGGRAFRERRAAALMRA